MAIPLPGRMSDRFDVQWAPAKRKFKSPYVAGGIKRIGRTPQGSKYVSYRQPIRNDDLYKMDYKQKLKGCTSLDELDEMEGVLLEEAERHKANLGAERATQRAQSVKAYASKQRATLTEQTTWNEIEQIKQKYLDDIEKKDAEELIRRGHGAAYLPPTQLVTSRIRRDALAHALEMCDRDEPGELLSPSFFHYAPDIDTKVFSPQKYLKPRPRNAAEVRERMASHVARGEHLQAIADVERKGKLQNEERLTNGLTCFDHSGQFH
ncbi:uncharacterized protein [Heptranchias perlo]|uniref:uncharacterized protein n=1 Tax=Heptranchias perlo TaxID=212740 RepID=UPI003559B674